MQRESTDKININYEYILDKSIVSLLIAEIESSLTRENMLEIGNILRLESCGSQKMFLNVNPTIATTVPSPVDRPQSSATGEINEAGGTRVEGLPCRLRVGVVLVSEEAAKV